jgi:hypothetical protein
VSELPGRFAPGAGKERTASQSQHGVGVLTLAAPACDALGDVSSREGFSLGRSGNITFHISPDFCCYSGNIIFCHCLAIKKICLLSSLVSCSSIILVISCELLSETFQKSRHLKYATPTFFSRRKWCLVGNNIERWADDEG